MNHAATAIVRSAIIYGLGLSIGLSLVGCSSPLFQPWAPPQPPAKNAPTRATPTPKFVQVAGPLMASENLNLYALAPVDPDDDTNSVLRVPFVWGYTGAVTIQYYKLHIGPSPGFYTTEIITGATNAYVFCTTNWTEETRMHFYAVTAVDVLGRESPYSNEVFFPPYPPDRYRLTWTNPAPATIISAVDVTMPKPLWPIIVETTQGMLIFTAPLKPRQQFFDLYRSTGPPDLLTVDAYNPLNE